MTGVLRLFDGGSRGYYEGLSRPRTCLRLYYARTRGRPRSGRPTRILELRTKKPLTLNTRPTGIVLNLYPSQYVCASHATLFMLRVSLSTLGFFSVSTRYRTISR